MDASGGAIDSGTTTTVANSTLSGNATKGSFSYGGAIYSRSTLAVMDSTLSGNSTAGDFCFTWRGDYRCG